MFKKTCIFLFLLIQWMSMFTFAGSPNYGGVLDKIVDNNSPSADQEVRIGDRIQSRSINTNAISWEQIRDFLAYVAIKIIIPIFVFAGIIVAIIGFYKLFASTSNETQKEAWDYILRWIIGVIIMVSAWYITNMLVGTDGTGWMLWWVFSGTSTSGTELAAQLYTTVLFPFIKIAIYVILGVLFIFAIIHAFKYIFSNGEEIQKQSVTILVYNTMGILVIILAKSMVESVYGSYNDIIAWKVDNLGKIWKGIFNELNFFRLHTAMNRILWLVTFIILIILVYQGYMLMMNPSDEEVAKKLKKSLWYIFIGILIIGAWYLITNFFIIT